MPAKRLTWLVPLLPLAVHAALVGYVVDGDGDGVPDERDLCPYTPPGAVVDEFGCSGQEDLDGDGVPDLIDRCPFTPPGAVVDAHGCAIDSDFDGVADGLDLCPGTPLGAVVDERGCAWGQVPVSGTKLAQTPAPSIAPAGRPIDAPSVVPTSLPTATPVAIQTPTEAPGDVTPAVSTSDVIPAATVSEDRSIPVATPAPAAAPVISHGSSLQASARSVAARFRLLPLQAPIEPAPSIDVQRYEVQPLDAQTDGMPTTVAEASAPVRSGPPDAPAAVDRSEERVDRATTAQDSGRKDSVEAAGMSLPRSRATPIDEAPRQWLTEVVFETEQLSDAWKTALRQRLMQEIDGTGQIEVVGFTSADLPSSRVIPRVLQVEALAKQWGIPPERIRHVIRPAVPGQRVGTVVVYRR